MLGAAAHLPWPRINLIVPLALGVAVLLAVVIDAAVVARRERFETTRRYQRWWALVLLYAASYVTAVAIAYAQRAIFIEAFVTPTESMADTLRRGDRFLVNHAWYRFRPVRRGDVIVHDSEGGVMVKRVSGLPGDVVEVRAEQLFVNGQAVIEPYVRRDGEIFFSEVRDFGPYTVPDSHLFCLGDNRRRSYDSRFTGPVPIDQVLGRATMIYLSSEPSPFPPEKVRQGALEAGTIRWWRMGNRF